MFNSWYKNLYAINSVYVKKKFYYKPWLILFNRAIGIVFYLEYLLTADRFLDLF